MPLRVLTCFLALVWLAGCQPGEQSAESNAAKGGCTYGRLLEEKGLIVVPLSNFRKKRIDADEEGWHPIELLKLACPQPQFTGSFEIDERTEFYAFYSPQDAKAGSPQLFSWYFSRPPRLFTKRRVMILTKYPGFLRPLAISRIWSRPHGRSKFLSMGGLNSVRSKAQWEKSRIFGPRTLKISRLAGFEQGRPRPGETLAEISFEIHETGVRVY